MYPKHPRKTCNIQTGIPRKSENHGRNETRYKVIICKALYMEQSSLSIFIQISRGTFNHWDTSITRMFFFCRNALHLPFERSIII